MTDDDAITELLEAAANTDLDDEEDWELLIREAELHELVAQHKALDRVVDAIEKEMGFRTDQERQIAAGSDADREYARANGDEAY